jgi:DNA-binding response OmpR family regulator
MLEMREVLIVEDDSDFRDLLRIHLNDLNCRVRECGDGLSGLAEAQSDQFDLIVLDLMLPKMDGMTVCQRLRASNNYTPVLMLSAKSQEMDKVMGLESGADDYLTKPFGIPELVARVNALFRRSEMNSGNLPEPKILRLGSMEIYLSIQKVCIDKKRLDLTPKEYQLLIILATSPGRSFTRCELLSQVWGSNFRGNEHTINSHINRLRAKIESASRFHEFILTSWGVGYRFNEEL